MSSNIKSLCRRTAILGIVICFIFQGSFLPFTYLALSHQTNDPENTTFPIPAELVVYGGPLLSLAIILTIRYFKTKIFSMPMHRANDSFEDDFSRHVFSRSLILYIFSTVMLPPFSMLSFALSGLDFLPLLYFLLSVLAYILLRPSKEFLGSIYGIQKELATRL